MDVSQEKGSVDHPDGEARGTVEISAAWTEPFSSDDDLLRRWRSSGERAAAHIVNSDAELRVAITGAPPGASRTSELDRLIHERIRLGIVSALGVNEGLSFYDLKALLRTTDG